MQLQAGEGQRAGNKGSRWRTQPALGLRSRQEGGHCPPCSTFNLPVLCASSLGFNLRSSRCSRDGTARFSLPSSSLQGVQSVEGAGDLQTFPILV